MPYSFTQIEKDKSRIIAFVFFFLILFYFVTIWIIVLFAQNYIFFVPNPTLYDQKIAMLSVKTSVYVFLFAFGVALIHWYFSVNGIIERTLQVLGAQPVNTRDSYHQMFQNIVEEVSIATGGRKIEAVVIPIHAMNAFALEDFNGRAVIGVTEGLLSRLTRAQIEAVVGHEAAHVVSGDCLATTVTSAMGELYNGMLQFIASIVRGERRGSRYNSRSDARVLVFLWVVYLLLSLTKFLSLLLRMFISRECEFRADAVAVRLTRDPLSLAEALYAISHRWRGSGLPAEAMEAIFIINPKFSLMDESENFLSNLFSTHPPVKSRLGILLDLAKAAEENLALSLERIKHRPKQFIPEIAPFTEKILHWNLYRDGQWIGPFDAHQVMNFNWVKPETWVQPAGGKVIPAYEDPVIANFFKKAGFKGSTTEECPLPYVFS